MRFLFLLCAMCLVTTAKAQQYTITADTSTCRIQITKGNGEEFYMFVASNTKYVDRPSDQILIFDDISSFRENNNKIVSHASIAALKTDIDTWVAACQ